MPWVLQNSSALAIVRVAPATKRMRSLALHRAHEVLSPGADTDDRRAQHARMILGCGVALRRRSSSPRVARRRQCRPVSDLKRNLGISFQIADGSALSSTSDT